PMPSFADLIDQKFLTDEELWRLAQYVRSLSPNTPPEVRDVVHAPQVPGTVPVSPDDSAWTRVARSWFPLVGQVIHKSRWFAPAVAGVDRKSTRLNSSHVAISYAVFCLKKKKIKDNM